MEPDRVEAIARRYADYEEDVAPLIESFRARLEWRRRRGFKRCDRCKAQKKPHEFGIDSRNPDGLRRVCRSCRSDEYRDRVNAVLA
jgi:hypothetical protein